MDDLTSIIDEWLIMVRSAIIYKEQVGYFHWDIFFKYV